MFRLELSAITLSKGSAVRIRPVAPGGDIVPVVERWNGSAWVPGPDVLDWASGRPATAEELAGLGIPTSDWPPHGNLTRRTLRGCKSCGREASRRVPDSTNFVDGIAPARLNLAKFSDFSAGTADALGA